MRRRLTALPLFLALAGPAGAADVTLYEADGSFEDAAFALEAAITGRGLVIDHVSHVGEMLARTREDVGSEVALFEEADIYLFCSAVVSRAVMEADPDNIAHCPYGVFVREMAGGGRVEVGFRSMTDPSLAPVQALLDGIAREAAGLDF